MIRVLLLATIFLLPITSYAELTFEQLKTITITPENLDGNFTQEKYLVVLDTTLDSSGQFNYQRGKTIRWETLEPIQNELIMTPTEMVNKQGDHELVRMDTDANPTISVMSVIFFSVLTAEWETLSEYFQLSGTLDGEEWQAELVPLDKTILQIISRVELKGDSLLHEIVMHENSGNKTTIHFKELKTEMDPHEG